MSGAIELANLIRIPVLGNSRGWLLAGMTALLVCRTMFPSESAAIEGDGLPVVMLWLALLVVWLLGAIGQVRTPLRLGCTAVAMLVLVGWHSAAGVWAAQCRARARR